MNPAEVRRRIGEPVAIRIYRQLSADHGLLLGIAADGVAEAGRLFSSSLARVYATGGERDGHITVMAEYAGGQTALICAEACRMESPMETLLILGNHGSLQQDGVRENTPGAGQDQVREAIRKSLESREAVDAT